MIVDGEPLATVLRPPNLPIASGCFGCVVSLGYLTAVTARHARWSTPMIVLPLVTLCAAARAVRRTRVGRARSMALFEMSSAAQRAGSDMDVLSSLSVHGRDALRSPEVGLVDAPAPPRPWPCRCPS